MVLIDARPALLSPRRRGDAAPDAQAAPSPAVEPPAAGPRPDRRRWPTQPRLAGVAGAVVGTGVPVGLVALAGGALLALALFFLKTGAFTFGSGS